MSKTYKTSTEQDLDESGVVGVWWGWSRKRTIGVTTVG